MSQLTLDQAGSDSGRLARLRRRPSAKNTLRPSIAERFATYHRKHPEVYDLLVTFARDVKARGKSSYGMKAIFERARWHYHIEKGDEEFVLNNDFTAHYARLIEAQEPDLMDFFEKRRLRSE